MLACVIASHAAGAKLIEWGFDEPGPAFMRAHLAEMERSPFDGVVYHLDCVLPKGERYLGQFHWQAWGTRVFHAEEFDSALVDLKATRFRRLRSNFLRFNTTPGNVDWFDDHAPILNNARLAARIAREAGSVGLMFDIEQYQGRLFDYRRQRDAQRKSFAVYAAQARKRGREVMQAFQSGYPDLTIMLTYGYCLPWVQTEAHPDRLERTDYGLLPAFLDGMVEAAKGRTRIVDGFELSYGYKHAKQFADGYRMMKEGVLPIVARPDRYKRYVSAAFGVWVDNDWRRLGWDTRRTNRNYFTADALTTSVREALRRTDEYVWIYTESPRWWSDHGVQLNLPPAYENAIRRARAASRPAPKTTPAPQAPAAPGGGRR